MKSCVTFLRIFDHFLMSCSLEPRTNFETTKFEQLYRRAQVHCMGFPSPFLRVRLFSGSLRSRRRRFHDCDNEEGKRQGGGGGLARQEQVGVVQRSRGSDQP